MTEQIMKMLIERLRNPAFVPDGPSPRLDGTRLNETAAIALMYEAADMIEYLRSLAGAVTQGERFADTRADTRKKDRSAS